METRCGQIVEKTFIRFIVPSLVVLIFMQDNVLCYSQRKLQACSHRLEHALEQMRHRNIQVKIKKLSEATNYMPYRMYHTLYAHNEDLDDDFYQIKSDHGIFSKYAQSNGPTAYATHNGPDDVLPNRQAHKLKISRVDVEELQVKLPSTATEARWVQVDKCKFNSENSTLDTRLVFPDLMLSGKVIIQPSGGKCNMILRLRHAGIEFHTKPIGLENNEESRRIYSASVRTDSHFAEPGFISVFAHGCEGPTGIKIRRNSKRRFSTINGFTSMPLEEEFSFDIGRKRVNGKLNINHPESEIDGRQQKAIDDEVESDDILKFHDDVLHVSDDAIQNIIHPDARNFADVFSRGERGDQVSDALINELEKLFSMGVRGLLTTYMQKALQPAIKETLMENMGFTISYG